MKYKLYKEPDSLSPTEHVLRGRGIENVDEWLAANEENFYDWGEFGSSMIYGMKVLEHAIQTEQRMTVIVDSDLDGFASAAMFINFLYSIFPHYVEKCIDWYLHTGKQHGLTDFVSENKGHLYDYGCVICPDSASNDFEQQALLSSFGTDVLILDHHVVPEESEVEFDAAGGKVVVINNQTCDYPNKDLCGAGVVWQFCRAYQDVYGIGKADDYLDLCAVANVADMMDIRSLETKAIINEGLKRIKNPLFKAMFENGTIKYLLEKRGTTTPMAVAFSIAPYINAVVRSGTMEEKRLVFESMLEQNIGKQVLFSGRIGKGQMVDMTEEALQVLLSVKRRQTSQQDAAMEELEGRIAKGNMLDNAALMFLCEAGVMEKNLQGLVANKLMAKYQRPCFVLTKSKTKDDKEYFYRGSARGYGRSEIDDLRQVCEDTGLVEYAQGHAQAHGLSIPEKNVDEFLARINEALGSASQGSVYWVDYVWKGAGQVSPQTVLEVAEMMPCWGQEVPEALVAVESIDLSQVSVNLLSPDKHPTLKLHLPCGIDIMKFKSSQEEYEEFTLPNKYLTLVGICKKNEWNGKVTPQIIIEDFELTEEWAF